MDEKTPLLPRHSQQDDINSDAAAAQTSRQKRTSRLQMAAFLILITIFWLARSWTCGAEKSEEHVKVPLEVHIMSKCPDARDCLSSLVVPSMANISSKVSFRLSFIGNATASDDGVQCMHGQTECLGNILMLCAANEYPDPKLYLGFSNCLIGDYKDIPSRGLIQDCALEHGLDFDVLNECMSKDTGAYGMGLLRDSVTRSKDLGINTSCTVRLDEKVRCVRDGGEWRNCTDGSKPVDLIRDVNKLYAETNGYGHLFD